MSTEYERLFSAGLRSSARWVPDPDITLASIRRRSAAIRRRYLVALAAGVGVIALLVWHAG